MDKENEDKDIQEFFEYLNVVNKVCKEKGKLYEFECPICKGKAKAIKSSYNGHLWSECKKCNMIIAQ